jgi:inner membrane protein
MASAFGHAVMGTTLGSFQTRARRTPVFLAVMAAVSILPDIDVIGFRLGVPYASAFGHRGFTHSLLFAICVAGALRLGTKCSWATALLLFLSTASHGILDAFTDGGLGVGFFIPFSERRYFFPFRPIRVSPISFSSFFTGRASAILLSELTWIGGACALLLLGKGAATLVRSRFTRRAEL